jgi:integron integrase
VRRFVRFHGMRHPAQLAESDVTRFLSWLAEDGRVSAATQTQAASALVFLYREVLNRPLGRFEQLVRAKQPRRLPVVLTREEVAAVLAELDGSPRLVCELLYGSGLRLLEALRLRVKDVDLGAGELVVRRGKGEKDRVTVLPQVSKRSLTEHLARVQALHLRDLARGAGRVLLPGALARKLPAADRSWPWQWVFPASRLTVLDAIDRRGRHHLHESVVQRAMHGAVCSAGLTKRATCHTLRHSLLFRDASAGGRLRHQNGAGAAGAPGCEHDDDLHARAQPGRAGGAESMGGAAPRLGWQLRTASEWNAAVANWPLVGAIQT